MKDTRIGIEVSEMRFQIVVVVVQHAESKVVTIGRNEVDDDRILALLLGVESWVNPVVTGGARIRQRVCRKQADAVGTQLARRNHVAGIKKSGRRAHNLNGGAIEDVRAQQFAEVALAHQRRRRLLCRQVVVVVFHPLLSEQKEELPPVAVEVARKEEWSIEIPAELVITERCPAQVREVSVPGVCVQRTVAKIFEQTPMKFCRSASGNHPDLTT